MSRSLIRVKNTLFGNKAFYVTVITLLVPMIIQNTVTNFVSLLDNIMVGRVGTFEMSSVGIINQLLLVFNLCIFGGVSGAGIFSAQYAGAKNNEGVRQCFRVKIITAFVLTVAAVGIFTLLSDTLINLYIAEDSAPNDALLTLNLSKDYLEIMLLGLLPFALSQAYASTLRELGQTKFPMIASVVSITTNLILNYILIFGHFGFDAMGVRGAAIATVIARFTELIIIILLTHINRKKFEFIRGAYRSLKVSKALLLDILKRGSPLIINETMWSAGMAMLLQCYSVRGLDVVAAQNISSTVSNLFNVIFYSMGGAISIMVGQYLGALKNRLALHTSYKLITFSVLTSVVMGSVMALLSPFIPLLYNTTDSVRNIASDFLIIVGVFMPIYSFAHGCYFTLRSGGRTVMTTLFDSGFTWCISVPAAYILANFTALPIIPFFVCIQCIDIIKCLLGFVFVKKGIWIRNIVKDKS